MLGAAGGSTRLWAGPRWPSWRACSETSRTPAAWTLGAEMRRAEAQLRGTARPPTRTRSTTITRSPTWTRATPWTALRSGRRGPLATRARSQGDQTAPPRSPPAPGARPSRAEARGRAGPSWRARSPLSPVRPLPLLFLQKVLESPPAPEPEPTLPGPAGGTPPRPPAAPGRSPPPKPRALPPALRPRNRSQVPRSLMPLRPRLPGEARARPRGPPSRPGRAGPPTGR